MRTDQLTFTRFIAAVAIVIFHSKLNMFPFKLPLLHTIFSNASLGVSYFFILSGFVMVIAYGKNKSLKIDPKSYYLNRFARIYPVYFVALVLSVIVALKQHSFQSKSLLLQILAIQSWFPGSVIKLNYPGWSISVEVLFYVLFPVLFNFVYRKYSFKTVAINIICFWAVTQIALHSLFYSSFYHGHPSKSDDFLFYFPLMHLNEFLIGNVLGFAFLRLKNVNKNFDLPIVVVFIAILAVLSFNTVVNYHDGLMAIIFAPFILLMSLNNGIISKLFSNKYLIVLGEASYGMYILQFPIKIFCYYFFAKIHLVNDNLTFYSFLIILIVVSIACYYLVEIPAKNWIKGFKSIKSQRTKLTSADDRINF